MKHFIRRVQDSNSGYIQEVVRVKNLFDQLKNCQETGKYVYADIKINVITEYNNIAIVGEVQFLMDFMLEASYVTFL